MTKGQSETRKSTPSGLAPRRVLVVDDMVGAAHVFSRLLKKLGNHEVALAHSGEEAVEVVGTFHPDVVLLDIGLPGMDGFQTAETIRRKYEVEQMLLVALTGYGKDEDRKKSADAGFDVHLVKPPDLEDIEALFVHRKLKTPANESPVPEQSPEEPESAGSDDEQWRKLLHELGNQAHAIGLSAAILARAKDESDYLYVQRMLKDTEAEMQTLIKKLRAVHLPDDDPE